MPLLRREVAEGAVDGFKIVSEILDIGEIGARGAEIILNAGQCFFGDEGADIVEHHAFDRGVFGGGQHHAANAAQRGANPINIARDVGEQMGERGDIGERVVIGSLSEPIGAAAAREVGA